VLRTRSPLGLRLSEDWLDLVRLACVKHAASVRPEPGSNSPTKACRHLRRLPLATNDWLSSAGAEMISPLCSRDLTDYICVSPEGYSGDRIDKQCVAETETASPDELPALAFCLLFRFQGAEARTSASRTRPARCSLFRGSKPSVERRSTLLRSCQGDNPSVRKLRRRGGVSSVRVVPEDTGRAAAAHRPAGTPRSTWRRWRGTPRSRGCGGHRPWRPPALP
jgi:hypothetical protein